MAVTNTAYQNIARAVSAYADQEYTDARRIAGTAVVGTDARISANEEDFYGTIRWDRTLGGLNYTTTQSTTDTHVNIASETDDEGLITNVATDFAEYVKSVRTHGADEYNVTQVITQRDGAIAKIARDFGVTRARDEDAALVSILGGIAGYEASFGTNSAGQTDPDTLDDTEGFFYNVGGNTGGSLIDTTAAGGKAAAALWQAVGAAYSDQEDDFYYLVTSPSVYQDMRTANLLDEQDRVTDGNVQFATLLDGMFRIIVTRSNFGNASTHSTAIPAANNKTSLLLRPGAISMSPVAVPNPVAFDADESLGRGAGKREAWYRWGYVMHPRGYTWAGSKTAFATNATYEANASWTRKETVGNLGILPIFHS